MSESTLVYSDNSVSSTDNVVSINRHTDAIYFMNQGNVFADVKLNGNFIVRIGYGQDFAYTEIVGDYTTFQVLTANVALAVYAVG